MTESPHRSLVTSLTFLCFWVSISLFLSCHVLYFRLQAHVTPSPPAGSISTFLASLLPAPSYNHAWHQPYFVIPHHHHHVQPEPQTTTTTTTTTTEPPPVYETRYITYPILVPIKPKSTTTTTTTTTEAPTTEACKIHNIVFHHHHHVLNHTTTTTSTTTAAPATKCYKHHKHYYDYLPNIPPAPEATSPMSVDSELPAPLSNYDPVTATADGTYYNNPYFLADLHPK